SGNLESGNLESGNPGSGNLESGNLESTNSPSGRCTVRFDNGMEYEIQGVYEWNRYNWRWL
ncbi:MAG TPA: hypothetical protein V6C88_09845, partial [Chroococcidiopsis sp.]